MNVRVVKESPITVTVGWDPVQGADGYAYYRDGVRVARTFRKPLPTTATFAKPDAHPHSYGVAPLLAGTISAVVAPHPAPPTSSLGKRVVYFSGDITDHACQRFADLGPAYTARISADLNLSRPGGAYFVSDDRLAMLRAGGGRVESWCDSSATPTSRAVAFAQERGLDGASGQFEDVAQWHDFRSSGLLDAIGNPAELRSNPVVLAAAVAFSNAGGRLIGEVFDADPTYSAQGVATTSVCFYVDRDAAQGGYQPLSSFAVMPPGERATASIYTWGKASDADRDLYAAWTRP